MRGKHEREALGGGMGMSGRLSCVQNGNGVALRKLLAPAVTGGAMHAAGGSMHFFAHHANGFADEGCAAAP